MTNFDKSYLMVKCKMWQKEENNLIQYDISNKICERFKINSNSYFIKNEKNIQLIDLNNQIIYNNNKLFCFERINNDYFIKINKIKPNLLEIPFQNCAYLVYKGFPSDQLTFDEKLKYKRYYKLNEGDILKIGKVFLKVHKINLKSIKKLNILNLNDSNLTLLNNNSFSIKINGQEITKGIVKNKSFNKKNILLHNNENNLLNSSSMKNIIYNKFHKSISLPKILPQNLIMKDKKILKFSSNILNKKNCRICFSNESNDSNPLLSPCKCDGSLKYIHYKCLKNWINTKINNDSSISEDDLVISYDSKEIKCEICKENYPDYIYYHNRYYNIKFYTPSFKKYMILESFRNDNYKSNFFHILSLENKDLFVIGRAEETDFCIPELSISRFHCILHIQNNEIYLEDNGSKYGSLILLQNSNIKMIERYKLKIQINSIYFNIKLIRPFSLFSCCSINEDNYNYQFQNSKKINIFNSLNIIENNDDTDEEIIETFNKHVKEIKIKKIKINSNKEKKNTNLVNELSTTKNDNINISNQANIIKIPLILKNK